MEEEEEEGKVGNRSFGHIIGKQAFLRRLLLLQVIIRLKTLCPSMMAIGSCVENFLRQEFVGIGVLGRSRMPKSASEGGSGSLFDWLT